MLEFNTGTLHCRRKRFKLRVWEHHVPLRDKVELAQGRTGRSPEHPGPLGEVFHEPFGRRGDN